MSPLFTFFFYTRASLTSLFKTWTKTTKVFEGRCGCLQHPSIHILVFLPVSLNLVTKVLDGWGAFPKFKWFLWIMIFSFNFWWISQLWDLVAILKFCCLKNLILSQSNFHFQSFYKIKHYHGSTKVWILMVLWLNRQRFQTNSRNNGARDLIFCWWTFQHFA